MGKESRRRTERELERYNIEDCLALKRIAAFVFAICEPVPDELSQPRWDWTGVSSHRPRTSIV